MRNAHVERHVDKLIAGYFDQLPKDVSQLPIDPLVLAQLTGNIDIEEREMIPEAAVEVCGKRFRVYLQSNFTNVPGARIRRRFSIAHEIAHTFFFEIRDGNLHPIRSAPRGLNLEASCHEGASYLLMPRRLLARRLSQHAEFAGEDLIRLARDFDVSLEVALRRLEQEPILASVGVSFALARDGSLEYATYPGNLGELLHAPAKGSIQSYLRSSRISLVRWFTLSGLEFEELGDGSLIGQNERGFVTARRIRVSASRDIFEMHRHEQNTPNAHLQKWVRKLPEPSSLVDVDGRLERFDS